MASLEEAAAAVTAGAVIGVPTDTVYGLAADPWDPAAIAKLFALKGRPRHRPVGLLAATVSQVDEIADLTSVRDLVDMHWPGALTLVVSPMVLIPSWIGTTSVRTVGVRVPDHEGLRALLLQTGPLAVTSANRSGEPDTLDDVGARAVFGDEVVLYLPGRCLQGRASTVIDATGPKPVVLRQGSVTLET